MAYQWNIYTGCDCECDREERRARKKEEEEGEEDDFKVQTTGGGIKGCNVCRCWALKLAPPILVLNWRLLLSTNLDFLSYILFIKGKPLINGEKSINWKGSGWGWGCGGRWMLCWVSRVNMGQYYVANPIPHSLFQLFLIFFSPPNPPPSWPSSSFFFIHFFFFIFWGYSSSSRAEIEPAWLYWSRPFDLLCSFFVGFVVLSGKIQPFCWFPYLSFVRVLAGS